MFPKITFVLAILGALTGVAGTGFGVYNTTQTQWVEGRIAAREELAAAWDILGGGPGTKFITRHSHSPQELVEARRHIENALLLDPDFAEAHWEYCVVLRKSKEIDEAVAECRRALELQPRSPNRVHNSYGNALQAKGDNELALAEYKTAIAEDPGLFPAYRNAIDLLLELGRLEEALELAEQEVGSAPESALPYFERGRVWLRIGDIASAERDFEDSKRRDPRMAAHIEEEIHAIQGASPLEGPLSP